MLQSLYISRYDSSTLRRIKPGRAYKPQVVDAIATGQYRVYDNSSSYKRARLIQTRCNDSRKYVVYHNTV